MDKGQRVKVFMSKGEVTLSMAMYQFHGIETKISGHHSYATNGRKRTYYLEGCESRYGIPYEFLAEWLIPLDESEDSNG